MFVKQKMYSSWSKLKNDCTKCLLSISDPSPPPSVYLGRHWRHSRDKMDQAFPLRVSILQAIKCVHAICKSCSFFESMDTLYWELVLFTHSLASLQWSGFSDQQMLLPTKNCLQCQKWCPYKGRGVVSTPICAIKVRNSPASANQGLSIASQDIHHVHDMS